MAQPGKKVDNLNILSDIYHEENSSGTIGPRQRNQFIPIIKKYFRDPKTVEKWLAGAVLFFGVLGIGFGFSHFKNQILRPFNQPLDSSQITLGQAEQEQDLLGLRQRDTDQDGLSDYDELNVYSTSPYLEDSDSDGLKDQDEIARGSDPACPQGQDCSITPAEVAADVAAPEADLVTDSTQLRALLLEAGVPADTLENISDEELLKTYQEVLGSAGATTEPTTAELPVNDIKQLTPDQVRQLLREQGVAEATLRQISDQELMELVDETVQGF